MIQEELHKRIVKNCEAVCAWYEKRSESLAFPIYASFDVRDSGCKVGPVDANLFPAGFNNICQVDKDNAPTLMKKYLSQHYPSLTGPIGLLAEEHTANAYYWENVASINTMIQESGYKSYVCLPRTLEKPLLVKSSSGKEVQVFEAENRNGEVYVNHEKMNLIVSNNDFSDSYEEWGQNLQTPINPPREMGWYRRRKHSFFQQYNQLAGEFARLNGVDEQMLQIQTELFQNFDVSSRGSIEALASRVDEFVTRMRAMYKKWNIETEPFCFIKNNAGTYGLAVVKAQSGEEVLNWNNRTRTKMKAAKGGREVSELIIQEGVPTRFRDEDGGSAEPCIYLIGGELVGGFLRTHAQKGPDESLNSPGAVFKRLCMSDLEINLQGCPMENVYGWVSKLGALALALEAKSSGVAF